MADNIKITKRDRRIAVFSLLFSREFDKDTDIMEFYRLAAENTEVAFNAYVEKTFLGTCEKTAEIDAEIENISVNWKISRMSRVTRSILRLAVYEMLYTTAPAKAIINEAVELAKEYDDDAAPAFINGILNKVARKHDKIADIAETQAE
ncbi:MAG: transcription antitermination factor NusB [Clostridia bacterium]|nr:transcription antitermination factor NusB [Clostridia bacterium]